MSRIVHCQILTEACAQRLSLSLPSFLPLCLPSYHVHSYTYVHPLSLSLSHTNKHSTLNSCAPIHLSFINLYLYIASIQRVMLRFPILLFFAVLLPQFVKCSSSTKYFRVLRYSINFHSSHRTTLVIFKKEWQLLFTSFVPLSLNSKTLAVLLCTALYCQTQA